MTSLYIKNYPVLAAAKMEMYLKPVYHFLKLFIGNQNIND